jgi:tripeptidyl-peptidase-1
MFQVNFENFQNSKYGTIIRTLDPYTLPREIAKEVVFVTGLNRFPPKIPLKAIHTKRSTLQSSVTPQTIWNTFNTKGIKGTAPNNIQAVAQFLEQYFDPQDLSQFQSHFNIPSQPAAQILGPNDPTNPGTEALLDIEYIIGTAPNIPTWFWSTGGLYNGQEPFVQWAMNVNAATTVPLVISVSYGDEESSVPKDYTDRLNIELQKMAMRGISVLFASGDNGVGCTSACNQDPNWPASSPYITAVGGFYGSATNLKGDTISSGGFSNYYSMPDYQVATVTAYLSTTPNLPPAKAYNKTSRAMPDVSSYSENVLVFQGGFEEPVGGTSCASPVFAGIISLINDQMLQNSKQPLGFLNTALYKIGKASPNAFIDITTGSNENGCCQGFPATAGWDPITGWGGPNYPNLMAAFQSLQK